MLVGVDVGVSVGTNGVNVAKITAPFVALVAVGVTTTSPNVLVTGWETDVAVGPLVPSGVGVTVLVAVGRARVIDRVGRRVLVGFSVTLSPVFAPAFAVGDAVGSSRSTRVGVCVGISERGSAGAAAFSTGAVFSVTAVSSAVGVAGSTGDTSVGGSPTSLIANSAAMSGVLTTVTEDKVSVAPASGDGSTISTALGAAVSVSTGNCAIASAVKVAVGAAGSSPPAVSEDTLSNTIGSSTVGGLLVIG